MYEALIAIWMIVMVMFITYLFVVFSIPTNTNKRSEGIQISDKGKNNCFISNNTFIYSGTKKGGSLMIPIYSVYLYYSQWADSYESGKKMFTNKDSAISYHDLLVRSNEAVLKENDDYSIQFDVEYAITA